MAKRTNHISLNSDKTRQLLHLVLHGPDDQITLDAGVYREQRLLDLLRSKLPLEGTLKNTLPAMIQSLSQELKTLSGSSIEELLLDAKTETRILIQIKEYAKERGCSAQDDIQREVALAVYYAAIAAALLHHNAKISEHPCKHLKEAFSKLREKEWLPSSLTKLFEAAQAHPSLEANESTDT